MLLNSPSPFESSCRRRVSRVQTFRGSEGRAPACLTYTSGMLLRERRVARLLLAGALGTAIVSAGACRRGPRVSDEVYRQAVTSFYVSLAAMQTGQDVHARQELDRLTALVPDEAAGWANLGLLLLRQQQIDEAATRLATASQLAPRNAAIERLLALTESRKGNLEAAVRHWRRAIELDTADLKAPYALAQELERLGGAANDDEGQRLFDALAARSGNLAASLEFARVAARRADAQALARALDRLAQSAPSWPADAQQRLTTVREAARGNPAAAATSVIFLKNVLIREPEYRAALAAVSTPEIRGRGTDGPADFAAESESATRRRGRPADVPARRVAGDRCACHSVGRRRVADR